MDLVNPETTIRVIMAGAPDRPQHMDSMDSYPLLVIGIDETYERPYLKGDDLYAFLQTNAGPETCKFVDIIGISR